MGVNKIIYGGKTLVDLTSDTVTAADLADGVKATGADGNPIVGLMQKVTIDAELSTTSTNPVQNKVIAKAIANMGGGSGGGVSTSEVNTWTAAQIFNDITINGLEQSEYVEITGNSITPTSSCTIWQAKVDSSNSLCTLNLDGLIAKTSKSSRFEIVLGGSSFTIAPTLQITSTNNIIVFCPENTRCSALLNVLHGMIVTSGSNQSDSEEVLAFIKIDTFTQDGSKIPL